MVEDIIVMFIGMVIFMLAPKVYGKTYNDYMTQSMRAGIITWSMTFTFVWSVAWSLHIFGKF